MGLRKFKCYRRVKRAYTRHSKYKKKDFVKVVPPSKIVKFEFGVLKNEFSYRVDLLSKAKMQVRSNAIESARAVIHRKLTGGVGEGNYFLKVRVYPHHILRENKMLVGAGADRMQTGMSHAFGRAIGTAAQVSMNQPIFSCFTTEKFVRPAKKAMEAGTASLPGKYQVKAEPVLNAKIPHS
mgnify:CR=1 FL=1